jgi:glycosyltransferase involved in cell wall biosynthesis
MKPAVVLHVPWIFDMLGGVDVAVDRLREGLERDGTYRPLIGVHDWDGSHPNHVNRHGRKFLPLALPRGPSSPAASAALRFRISAYRRALGLAATLRRHGVVVFHAHFPSLHLYSVALAKRLGLWRGKLVLSFHGSDASRIDPGLPEWRFIASQADAITACSRALASEIASSGLFATRAVDIAYNGIDADSFAEDARRGRWDELGPGPYLLGVGTFIPLKSQNELISAFAQIAEQFPSLILALAGGRGDAEWLARLEELAEASGLGDRVRFLVDVPHERIAALIAGARAFVHASRREGFSLVVLEAGAVRVPIIATNVGGIPELTGEDGALLYAPGDLLALIAAMREVLTDPVRRKALADRMYLRVVERFSVDAMTAAYLAQYRP